MKMRSDIPSGVSAGVDILAGGEDSAAQEVDALRGEVAYLCHQLAVLQTEDGQVAALAEQVVARQRAEVQLARLSAQVEAFAGTHEVRHVRLCDLHARFHMRPGDLIGPHECLTPQCGFWEAATFVLDSMPTLSLEGV